MKEDRRGKEGRGEENGREGKRKYEKKEEEMLKGRL